MRRMDQMFQDPFLNMFGVHPMLQGPTRGDQLQRGSRELAPRDNHMEMSPFGSFNSMFGGMFMNMNNMMSNMERTFVCTCMTYNFKTRYSFTVLLLIRKVKILLRLLYLIDKWC